MQCQRGLLLCGGGVGAVWRRYWGSVWSREDGMGVVQGLHLR